MFMRGLLGYLPANIIQGIVGVLTILVFTNLLTPREYGIYALALSLFTFAHVILFTWIEAAMARYWQAQKTSKDLSNLYASLYRGLMVLTLVYLPIVAMVGFFLPIRDELRWPVVIGLAGIPLRCLVIISKEAMRARGAVGQAVKLDISYTISIFLLGLGAILLGMGAAGPMIGFLIAPLLIIPFAMPVERRFAVNGQYDQGVMKQAAVYGFPIAIALGMATVLSSTDRFVIAYFMNEAAVGAYHASYSIANRTLDIMFIWLGAAGVPAMITALEKGGQKSLEEAAAEQFRTLMLLTMPAAVGVALVSRPLAEVLIGPAMRYEAASITPLIAAASFLAGLLYYYFNQAFVLAKRTDLLLLTMALPAASNIALNIILIPTMGLYGAAIATILSFIVAIISSMMIARAHITMPVPFTAIVQCAACSAVMACAVLALPEMRGMVDLLVSAFVGAVVYGACAYAIDAADVRSLAKRVTHLAIDRKNPANV